MPLSRDLIYLNRTRRVIQLIQSSSLTRGAPVPRDATSLLVLAEDSIRSSHTECGDQLLVCPVAEMEQKLTHIFEEAHKTTTPPLTAAEHLSGRPSEQCAERRGDDGQSAPLFVAWHWSRNGVTVDQIRDISEAGLYLITTERWPIGTTVKLNLQALVPEGVQSAHPVLMKMRVVRWGADGLALEIVAAEPRSEVVDCFATGVN